MVAPTVWIAYDAPMPQYKGHPIYAVALPVPGGWRSTGLIFEPLEQVAEIQRLESDLSFITKEKAEQYALAICRLWVDERGSKV
jgi:hypothetical protein